MSKLFSITNINRYFKISNPLKNTQGIIEAPQSHLQKIAKDNNITLETLMQKHNTTDKREAYKLELDQLKNNFQPSQEALEYLEQLNVKYKGKTIKFYYTDPMLKYFSIDDSDCDDIPIYEVLCEEIKFMENEKLPMILTSNKNYSLINILSITINEEYEIAKKLIQKGANKNLKTKMGNSIYDLNIKEVIK